MAPLGVRQRAGYLFLAVTVGHVVLISAQVNATSGVPILEAVAFGAFSEVQRATSAVVNGVRGVWRGYVALQQVRTENEALRHALAEAQVRGQAQQAAADRALGLERMLDLRSRVELATAAAQIIASGATPDFRTVTLDKGGLSGIRADMAVIAPAGVVGRVVVSSPRASKVQLLIDRNAAAGALVARSRAQGVVVGTGSDRLRMDYVSEISDVVVGDTVVTSGIDGIYPQGFVIGRVSAVERSGRAYRQLTVEPAVDFSSLEDVLVVLTPTPAAVAAMEAPR